MTTPLDFMIGKRLSTDVFEGDCPFKSGKKESIDLDTSFFVNGYLCRLEITHINGANPVFNEPELFKAFSTIDIVANGNEHIKTLKPEKVYNNEIRNFGKLKHSKIDKTANETVTSYVTFLIPFSMLKMIVGEDTILNTSVFSSLKLYCQWASDTSLGSNITINSGKLEVNSMGIENHRYNKNEQIKYYVENSIDEQEVTSNSDTFSFDLPNDKIYKSLVLTATVDGKLNDSVIEKIMIKSGSKVFLDWEANTVRARNAREIDVMDEDLLRGYYVIDPAQRGRITDFFNIMKEAGGYNKLTVLLKVKKGAGTTVVSLSSDEFLTTNTIPNKG